MATVGPAFAALGVRAVSRIVALNVPVDRDAGTSAPNPNPVPSGAPPSALADTENVAAAVKEARPRDVDDAIARKDWKRCARGLHAMSSEVAHPRSKVETARAQWDEEPLRLGSSKAPAQ